MLYTPHVLANRYTKSPKLLEIRISAEKGEIPFMYNMSKDTHMINSINSR